ncbi:MAG: hypothetical protein IKW82_05170 [Bacteroidales bacterium]|nr:hypothetical protein [Bacteroidales bacterium]
MNGKDEIIKKKLYIEGLKQAIEMSLPEEAIRDVDEILQDDETEESIKETMRLWKELCGPFDNAIVFVHNNRFLVEEKENIINDDSEAVFMMPEEMFNTLSKLLKSTVMEFLSVLEIPSNEKTQLLECVENGDKDAFVSALEHAQCDLTALARLCSCCMDDSSTGAEMKGDDFTYYLDYMAGYLHEKNGADNGKMLEAIKRWQPSAEVLDDDDSDEALNRYFSDYRHFLETDLATNLHYYWDWYDDFTLKERNLIDPILDNPLAKDLIDKIWEEYKNPKPKPAEPFTLPKDFFDWQHKSNTPKEYFYMDDALKKQGVDTFVVFIDWLAEKGYIADDNEVKALLAYRLTGRCRPEGEELPVIEWHGKNGKSYELIYLVRFLSDRGDYRKMRRFFIGPEWVKDRDSSYANSADSEFRKQMSEFYPEVCKFVV